MFRQPRRQGLQNNPLTPQQMATLAQANQLMAGGAAAAAAPLYVQIANEMDASNHPRRAANIHAQAAHAFADALDQNSALAQARIALNLFIKYQMNQRTPVFYNNIAKHLTNKGLTSAAAALQQEYGTKVGPIPSTPSTPMPQKKLQLPTNCPKCGAPLHQEEVSWTDPNTAECAYCGALIRATG